MSDLALVKTLVDTQEPIEIFDISDSHYRQQLQMLSTMCIESINSDNTRMAYRGHLRRFLAAKLPLSRLGVLHFLGKMKSVSVQDQALSAIRKLAREAQACHLLTAEEATGVVSLKVKKPFRVRQGQWLTAEGLRQLVSLPDRDTLLGRRDAAMMGLLAGCGLRRNEAVTLTWSQYRDVDGRMALVDIDGKGGRIRTVPVPEWARVEIDGWRVWLIERFKVYGKTEEEAIEGTLLRKVVNHNYLPKPGVGDETVMNVMRKYSHIMGQKIAPHDLRRTLAHLMRKAGVPVEQIQFTLGHAKMSTTELYLGGGMRLERGEAGVDKVEW